MYWRFLLGVVAVTTVAMGVPSRRGAAQTPDVAVQQRPELVELQKIRQLPKLLNERRRIADLAVALVRPDPPDYVRHVVHAQLIAPPFFARRRRFVPYPLWTPKVGCAIDHIYRQGAFTSVIKQQLDDADSSGCEGTYLPDGAVTATANAFFQLLGTNGRSCATCHQPPSGMSVSRANIAARLQATSGTDPIFAGVDGADCPSSLPPFSGIGTAFKVAHSLLLRRGLFRVFLSLPPGAQFTISAAGHDPNGCNTVAPNDQDTVNGQTVQMVSVYRRPRISANLNFVTSFVSPAPPPAPPSSAVIMWDTRVGDGSSNHRCNRLHQRSH